MNGEVTMTFSDSWLWLIFVGVGLLLILMELFLGLDTGLDMVFIGTAFLIGGLISWPFNLWAVTLIITAVICVLYVVLGRRYVHKRIAVKLEKMNVDAVIGSSGVVLQEIKRHTVGRVQVGNERWRAKAEEDIPEGNEIVVTGVTGATLTVKKYEGGS
ncbi:MAG: NfeD family protein [Dehalococcoidales bacterium]|nr:MAG: NfeD family protein [Dehalococcoidales bacterium]